MSKFIDSCVETAVEGAREAVRQSRGRPKGRKLLRVLKDKRRILVTCHRHPDPDALGSAAALVHLLRQKLPSLPAATSTTPANSTSANAGTSTSTSSSAAGGDDLPQPLAPPIVELAIKGRFGGGVNDAFTRHARLELVPWDDERILDRERPDAYDALILCDVQPSFPYSPLPEKLPAGFPTAIIDHHRARGRRPSAPFVDIRTDVGATASIVFSYYMELDVPVPPEIAAALLYAVESDLAGAAGQPSDLDNVALSNLTLLADTRRLYRMRHTSLPPHYYVSYANALLNAQVYGNVVFTHLERITSLETPAIIADFLLRLEMADWCVVTALVGGPGFGVTPGGEGVPAEAAAAAPGGPDGRAEKLLVSARTNSSAGSAGEAMRRAMEKLGEGGGHRTKAGGFIRLESGSDAEVERLRSRLRRRFLKALKLPPDTRGRPLIEPVFADGELQQFIAPE